MHEVANLGAAAHAVHEPSAEHLRWEVVAQAVRNFWLMVGPKLRDRPEAWPRVRLPAPAEAEIEVPPLAGPGEALTQAPRVEGPQPQDWLPAAEPQALNPSAEPRGIG
eukprot:1739053-Amphidinium_carterae.1